jgi:PTH1 family peptidyl-tRNA hydrolase
MLLLVGLGNPGPGYARHRHNIGFMAVDEIVRRHGFAPWRPRFDGEVAEGQVEGVRVLALKPMTYMNNSGHSVAAAARFFKVPETHTVVIHDEIEIAPGKLRVKQGGGNAGHNGLKSIDAQFGREYWRVRLGVGRPERAITDADPEAVANYVLHDFPKADRPWVEKMVEAIAENFPLLAAGDHNRFQNRVTLALKPPAEKPVKKEPPTTPHTEG